MARALANPTAIVALMAAGQVVVWTLAPSLIHTAPPLDVVEGYLWGREWIIASYKHPAMPSWILEISRLVTGVAGWPAYLVAQLFVAVTFMFVFLLGRDLMGPQRAAAGTLLLAGVAYYAWPTPTFDHNIAQLPFWAALCWVFWRAIHRRSVVWWLLVAVCASGALYAKLSSGLLLITAAAWMLYDTDARRSLATPAPWIALAVFAALVAPLGVWLVEHDFSPLKYAALRATPAPGQGLHQFLFSVFLNLAGVPLMMAAAGLIGRSPRAQGVTGQPPASARVDGRALRYMLALTLGPPAIALAGALLSGSNLRSPWATPMFVLIGLIGIALTSDRFEGEALKRLGRMTAGILVVVPIIYVLAIRFHSPTSGLPLRVNWPQAEIAERMTKVWVRETGVPLRIVTGEAWVAGLIALASADQPLVLGRGDVAPFPRISRSQLDAGGMLVVWTSTNPKPPLSKLAASWPVGEERFAWRYSATAGDLVINYAIIPPREPPD